MRKASFLLRILLLNVSVGYIAHAQIECNKFNVNAEIIGAVLNMAINTDLPDEAEINIYVVRSYLEKGSPEKYCIDYMRERSTVGEWRNERKIPIDNVKWETDFLDNQKKMAEYGLGFDVESISDKVEVAVYLSLSQNDLRFGKNLENLTGSRVQQRGRLSPIEEIIDLDNPLEEQPTGPSRFANLDPMNLDVGQSYTPEKDIALMPAIDPADVQAALLQIKRIPSDAYFTVHSVRVVNNVPWYHVSATRLNGTAIGTGWINSSALLGQSFKQYGERVYKRSTDQ